jgi:exosortase
MMTGELSHGFLIIAISGYLVWIKHKQLTKIPLIPLILPGSILLITGCFVYLIGRFGDMALVQEGSIVLTLLGLILLFAGYKLFLALLLPVLYLLFMFPFFSVLLGKYSIYFQVLSANIATNLLALTGMPAIQEGKFIILPHTTLDVVKECSGINHILTLVALSIPLALISRLSFIGKILLVLLSFFVGLFSNGVRIGMIGIWMKFQPDASIHGPFNTLIVSTFIMGVGSFLLLIVFILINKIFPSNRVETCFEDPPKHEINLGQVSNRNASVLAFIILSITGLFAFNAQQSPFPDYMPTMNIPLLLDSWAGKEVFILEEPYEDQNSDSKIKRIYTDPSGNKIKLFVAYFATQQKGKKLFNYYFDELNIGSVNENIGPFQTRMAIKGTKDSNKTVYFGYLIGGTITSNRFYAKYLLILNRVLHNKNSGMFYAVTIPMQYLKTEPISTGTAPHIVVRLLSEIARNAQL